VSARALSLVAALAAPIFLTAAVAGWLFGVWPANPMTLGISTLAVICGPLLGMFHVATATQAAVVEEEAADERPVYTRPPVINVAEARARAFHNWRDKENPVIEQRERSRRASQYLRA